MVLLTTRKVSQFFYVASIVPLLMLGTRIARPYLWQENHYTTLGVSTSASQREIKLVSCSVPACAHAYGSVC